MFLAHNSNIGYKWHRSIQSKQKEANALLSDGIQNLYTNPQADLVVHSNGTAHSKHKNKGAFAPLFLWSE